MDGDREAVAALLQERAAMVETARTDEWSSNFIATCLALVGDQEGALEWLDQSISWGCCNYRYIGEFNPFFVPLHGNSRFQQLVDKAREKHETLADL